MFKDIFWKLSGSRNVLREEQSRVKNEAEGTEKIKYKGPTGKTD